MTEPSDPEDARDIPPYHPEDFSKAQYVPPTRLQMKWAKLKIVGAVTGVMAVSAMCARIAGLE